MKFGVHYLCFGSDSSQAPLTYEHVDRGHSTKSSRWHREEHGRDIHGRKRCKTEENQYDRYAAQFCGR